MSHTYVIVNRSNKFYAKGNLWVHEYSEAYVMTDVTEANNIHNSLTPLMSKIIRDYGTEKETQDF